MIRTVWFCSYLTLFPEYDFFNSQIHSDTFYLSGLCESIKNFGYPANLTQGLVFHKYHYLSIVLLAGISKICSLPCFITYNFIYPIVFFPVFTFLFFQVIGVIRELLNKDTTISISDVVFSLFIIIGFLPYQFLNSLGIWWHDIFISESFCVSSILFFVYVFIINKTKKVKHRIINYLITFFFLFIITAAKISDGIMFFIIMSWIIIRKRGFNLLTIFSIIVGFILLLFSLSLFIRDSQNIGNRVVTWFHFATTYVEPEYTIRHFFFILFPALLLFVLSGGFPTYKSHGRTNNVILSEAALLITFCSILPGILFEIEGGSAVFFVIRAMFISLFFLLCFSVLQNNIEKINKGEKVLIALLLLVVYGESFFNYNYYHGSILIKVTPKYMVEQYQIKKHGNNEAQNNSFYKTLTKINKKTKGKKDQYCLFVTDNCNIFKLYKGNNYFIGSNGLLAITAYLGMPVIKTFEEANEKQIEKIIVLEKNTYKIISSK